MFRLHRHRGSALLWGVLLIPTLLFFAGMMVEWGHLYSQRAQMQLALWRALWDAAMQVDRVEYAYGRLQIDEHAARAAFDATLRRELRLDGNWQPIQPNAIVGQVVVEQFDVYNSYPVETPAGTADRPSVYARIRVPVRPLFFSILQPSVPIAVHGVVGITCPQGAHCER